MWPQSLLRVPCAKRLTRKNPVRPFEAPDVTSLEFLCNKNDCALFAHATHSKKRPQNLTIVRATHRSLLCMLVGCRVSVYCTSDGQQLSPSLCCADTTWAWLCAGPHVRRPPAGHG